MTKPWFAREVPESTAMTVRRVPTGTGSTPEPAFDSEWGDLDKLRWEAGLIAHDCGVPLTVHVSKRGSWGRPTTYDYSWRPGQLSWGDGGRTYEEMCRELRGFEAGVEAGHRTGAEAVEAALRKVADINAVRL